MDALARAPGTNRQSLRALQRCPPAAQLGDFEQAKSHLLKARSLFAAHLGLTDRQGARFIADGVLIGDLIDVGNKSAQELRGSISLWATLTGLLSRLPRKAFLASWSDFHRLPSRAVHWHACVPLLDKQQLPGGRRAPGNPHPDRAAVRVNLAARIELLWPLVPLGDCYWRMQDQARLSRAGSVRAPWSYVSSQTSVTIGSGWDYPGWSTQNPG